MAEHKSIGHRHVIVSVRKRQRAAAFSSQFASIIAKCAEP